MPDIIIVATRKKSVLHSFCLCDDYLILPVRFINLFVQTEGMLKRRVCADFSSRQRVYVCVCLCASVSVNRHVKIPIIMTANDLLKMCLSCMNGGHLCQTEWQNDGMNELRCLIIAQGVRVCDWLQVHNNPVIAIQHHDQHTWLTVAIRLWIFAICTYFFIVGLMRFRHWEHG